MTRDTLVVHNLVTVIDESLLVIGEDQLDESCNVIGGEQSCDKIN